MTKKRKQRRSGNAFKIFLFLLVVAILLGVAYYFFSDNQERPGVPVRQEMPEVIGQSSEVDTTAEYLPAGGGKIIRHKHYVLAYNAGHKQADWVYYVPFVGQRGEKAKRSDNFRPDPLVKSGAVTPADYTRSGYDRGHLCPAADMSGTAEAMSETFYMTNMSPQVPGFNRGIWKKLEEQVREWGERCMLWVVTGPVFKDLQGSIGQNQVSIPGYYYKVVYAPSRRQMLGFIFPNEKSARPVAEYAVSVDSVEHFTGLDFFPQLPDALENRLEAEADYGRWE